MLLVSYLWAELEDTLLACTAFALGGLELSLLFFFFFDTFCFSSEELWLGKWVEKKNYTSRLIILTICCVTV